MTCIIRAFDIFLFLVWVAILTNSSQVIVLGAGIVGVCTAISLIKRGLKVILIDRLPPASETSHGNAGVIADAAFTIVFSVLGI